MKHFLLLTILIISCFYIKAQDTIVKRDGEKIIGKIIEINTQNVSYKRFDNPDGPSYLLEKSLIISINYFNGNKDTFDVEALTPAITTTTNSTTNLGIEIYEKYFIYKNKRLSENQMHAVVLKLRNPDLNLMVRKIKNKKLIQEITFGASIPLLIYGFYEYHKDAPTYKNRGHRPNASAQLQSQKTGLAIIGAALACDAISICFFINRKKKNRLLVSSYNQAILNK